MSISLTINSPTGRTQNHFHIHISCLRADVREKLEAAGFPTLILNGDGCDRSNSSDGQIATRLNAFLEMLEGQNGK